MGLNRQQIIFLQHVAELIQKAPEYNLAVTAGELYRTPEQQKLHIEHGRSKTMNSQHLKRLAIDLNFFTLQPDGSLKLVYDSDSIRQLGIFWEGLDPANRWGGNWNNFKDTPHFERRETAVQPVAEVVRESRPTRGHKLLQDTVGRHGRNQHDDVETVQRLLNLNSDQFELGAVLDCDGIFGSKTLTAIQSFARAAMGSDFDEGLIVPGDAVFSGLCTALPTAFDRVMLSLLYLNASETDVSTFSDRIIDTMAHYQIETPLRQSHFLAQIGHECGELRFREELASGAAYEGRRDLGNHQPGDGKRFKGRGLIQLTGRANYSEYARMNRFDVDVVDTPEIVSGDERLCVDVAGWYWDRHHLNDVADRDDLEMLTRRINGGLNGLVDRRRLLDRAKTMLDIA